MLQIQNSIHIKPYVAVIANGTVNVVTAAVTLPCPPQHWASNPPPSACLTSEYSSTRANKQAAL